MRYITWALALPTILGVLGCGGAASPVAPLAEDPGPAPQTALGGRVFRNDVTESAVGLFTITVDPATLSATSELKQARSAQETDDIYELSIENFITPGTVKIGAISFGPTTLDIDYTISHPFAAPSNLAGPPTAANRADLGIAGRVVFLTDVTTATGNTYFTDVVAETTLVANPAGYYEPKGLLDLTGFTATAFPYLPLVDETQDPRTATASGVAISNGGGVGGNYDGLTGWQQSNMGPNRDGWTGYGVLHQGQSATNTVSIDLVALSTTPFSFELAILAKYADPRGGATGPEKKSNRLPGATADVTKFIYREPHGALDIESIEFIGSTGAYVPDQVSAATLRFRVADWDATATETTEVDLADEADPTRVAVGESGAPDLAVSIPGVTGDATSQVLLTEAPDDDDSGFGGDAGQDTGLPGDGLFYEESVQKDIVTGQAEGSFTGLVRATDPEMGLTNDWRFPVDPSLTPLAGAAIPDPVVYQKLTVDQIVPNDPPTLTLSTPATVASSSTTTIDVVAANDPDGDQITIEIDWDDNGSYEDTRILNPPYTPITYTRPGSTPYVNPGATPLTIFLPVRYTDSIIPTAIDYTPELSFTLSPPPTVTPGWARNFGGINSDRASSISADGTNSITAGFFTGTATFVTGSPRTSQAGTTDGFVVKHNDAGTAIWDFIVTGPNTDQALFNAVDTSGNIYVFGQTGSPTITFGASGPHATQADGVSGLTDAFLVKLNSSGVYQWHQLYGSPTGASESAGEVKVDSAGNVLLAGSFTSQGLSIAGGPAMNSCCFPSSVAAAFYAKLSSAGAHIWSTKVDNNSGTTSETGTGIAVDSANNVYGLFQFGASTVDVGGGPLPYVGSSDVGLFKWNPGGSHMWSKSFGGTGADTGLGVAVDATKVVVAGTYPGNALPSFGGGTPVGAANPNPQGYVVAYGTAGGAFQWLYTFGAASTEHAQMVAIDGPGSVYIAGKIGTGTDLGAGPLTLTAGSKFTTIKLSSAGTYQWAHVFGANVFGDAAWDVAVDSNGTLRFSGEFGGLATDFEPGPGVTNLAAAGPAPPGDAVITKQKAADGMW